MARPLVLRLPLLWAATGLALLFGPGLARAQRPALSPPVTPASQYLALGDSVTFGYMEAGVTPPPQYQSAANFAAYPEQLARALRLSVSNAACPGETSSSLVNPSGPSNGCENNPAHSAANYRTLHPLHVSYRGSQLAFALSYLRTHHKVRLVSLMIGANDFFVCRETTTDGCAAASEQAATAATVTRNIHTILSAIRHQAHYGGQIVIVNYYSLNYASSAVNAQSQLLNRTQDAAARPYHVEIANSYGEFEVASAHSGGSPCTAGLLTQVGGGQCGIHPSYIGQALLAQSVEDVIRLG